jgi:hypothetical protein
MILAGNVARIETNRNACRILVGEQEVNSPIGGLKVGVSNIEMDICERGNDCVDRNDLIQYRTSGELL